MQALSEDDRTKNRTGGEHCAVCEDDAQVVVSTHTWEGAEYEDYGPCPFCERGARLEFGKGGAQRWKGGFWKGQDIPESLVEKSAPSFRRPLSSAAQLAEIRRLSGLATKDMGEE